MSLLAAGKRTTFPIWAGGGGSELNGQCPFEIIDFFMDVVPYGAIIKIILSWFSSDWATIANSFPLNQPFPRHQLRIALGGRHVILLTSRI